MTITERLVERIGRRLGTANRRSFLASAAIVGSAVATHPWRYATRPATAYESICGDGAECGSGWTAFCCTVSGANQCPPGSFAAGWWKADRSSFCCGSARYYIDCNAMCGSDWECHCASGGCDQRYVACNQFRYGQCHLDIACYGPVVCRVITCTAPWEWSPVCGSTELTDNRTASHSAPCLPGACPSTITKYYYDNGGPGGKYGKVTVPERTGADGSRYAAFANAVMYTTADDRVWVLTGAILNRFRETGGYRGPLGFPKGEPVTVGGMTRVTFTTGAIYYSAATGAHSLSEAFYALWVRIGGVNSGLGLPTSERVHTAPDRSRVLFQHGLMYDSASTGTHVVAGRIEAKYSSIGGSFSTLGLPTAEQQTDARGAISQRFQHGLICYSSATGTHLVTNPLQNTYRELGGTSSELRLPVAEQRVTARGAVSQAFARGGLFRTASGTVTPLTGVFWTVWRARHTELGFPIGTPITIGAARRVHFQHGNMYTSAATGTHYVVGDVFRRYSALGGATGPLGLPTSDAYSWKGKRRVDFQGGSLVEDPATRAITRLP